MRIAVIADIHGNLPALQAVLEDIKTKQADQVFLFGRFGGIRALA